MRLETYASSRECDHPPKRLPPIITRLNSWPPILPVGRVSGAGRTAALADGAGVWGAGLGSPRRASGTAAEASREDVTKPRREICFAMLRELAISGTEVKNGMRAHGRMGVSGYRRYATQYDNHRIGAQPLGCRSVGSPCDTDIFQRLLGIPPFCSLKPSLLCGGGGIRMRPGRKDCPLAGFPHKMGESISMSPVILDRPDTEIGRA